MAFILLLLLSLTSLIQIESATAATNKSRLKSQQNALMGLQIALGELQRTMGPDQRVSATAEILTTDDNSIPSGKRHVVGVWSSAPDAPSSFDDPDHTNGQLISWLVSDGYVSSDTAMPSYNTTAAPVPGSPNSVVLVGAGSLPADASGNIIDDKDQIVVDLTNTTIVENGVITGHYGWWIGDEGVKARINLERPVKTTERSAKLLSVFDHQAFGVANASMFPGLDDLYYNTEVSTPPNGVNAKILSTLQSLDTLTSTNTTTPSSGPGRQYFHDFTTHSAGVLSDVRKGGLKKDLSLAFEMDDTDFNASEFAGGGLDPFDPWVDAPFKVQPVFSFNDNDYSGGDSFSGTANGPSWHLLRDYYQIYHRMITPMGNPTFNAQVFAPNLGHSKYEDPNTTSGNRIHDNQPAYLYNGGRGLVARDGASSTTATGTINDDASAPDGTVSDLRLADNSINPIKDDEEGDPLRSRESYLPTMVTANYMPYMLKTIAEWGLIFRKYSEGYQANIRPRTIFVLHNPYNVTLNHNDIAMETPSLAIAKSTIKANHGFGFGFAIDLRHHQLADGTTVPVSDQLKVENVGSSSMNLRTLVKARGLDGASVGMGPGQIESYLSTNTAATNQYMNPTTSGVEGGWRRIERQGGG